MKKLELENLDNQELFEILSTLEGIDDALKNIIEGDKNENK